MSSVTALSGARDGGWVAWGDALTDCFLLTLGVGEKKVVMELWIAGMVVRLRCFFEQSFVLGGYFWWRMGLFRWGWNVTKDGKEAVQ